MTIRKNDMVTVISGKEKGKTGKVLEVLVGSGRAFVEKLNTVKRRQKPTPKMPQGGMVEKESSIHLSNLMLLCAKCGRGVRTGIKVAKDGTRSRVCRKCGESIGTS